MDREDQGEWRRVCGYRRRAAVGRGGVCVCDVFKIVCVVVVSCCDGRRAQIRDSLSSCARNQGRRTTGHAHLTGSYGSCPCKRPDWPEGQVTLHLAATPHHRASVMGMSAATPKQGTLVPAQGIRSATQCEFAARRALSSSRSCAAVSHQRTRSGSGALPVPSVRSRDPYRLPHCILQCPYSPPHVCSPNTHWPYRARGPIPPTSQPAG